VAQYLISFPSDAMATLAPAESPMNRLRGSLPSAGARTLRRPRGPVHRLVITRRTAVRTHDVMVSLGLSHADLTEMVNVRQSGTCSRRRDARGRARPAQETAQPESKAS
jgi:hypothetical protein